MDRLPPFRQAALMLDMDGTLIDLAPTPDAVVVPAGLPDTLASLRDALDGALAIVTGRPIETVDRLFGDAPGAVAGEHGGAVRRARSAAVERPALPPPPAAWLEEAERLVARFPGALLERKTRGFALHYRLAPEAEAVFLAALQDMVAGSSTFQILPSHKLWEVRPVGADKGGAVLTLMKQKPFAGRIPVFIGDDVTDEDGMREARKLGGAGFRVDAAFGEPEGVRTWLRRCAEAGDWAALGS
ncbi:MAG TPA: trehalose-phosphatase [Rhodopila sp.]|nr:trehalose-phosphatase [Rhodopila sp.]